MKVAATNGNDDDDDDDGNDADDNDHDVIINSPYICDATIYLCIYLSIYLSIYAGGLDHRRLTIDPQ